MKNTAETVWVFVGAFHLDKKQVHNNCCGLGWRRRRDLNWFPLRFWGPNTSKWRVFIMKYREKGFILVVFWLLYFPGKGVYKGMIRISDMEIWKKIIIFFCFYYSTGSENNQSFSREKAKGEWISKVNCIVEFSLEKGFKLQAPKRKQPYNV